MDAEIIYSNPPIYWGPAESKEKDEYLSKQKAITKKLLEATSSNKITEFLVKLIYGEDFALPARFLGTKVSAGHKRVPELAKAAALIESYNDFRGEDLADVIEDLHDRGYIMEASFGREGSPVFYARAPYWTQQASNYEGNGDGRKIDDEQYRKMMGHIERRLKELNPDELGEDGYRGVRAWWD